MKRSARDVILSVDADENFLPVVTTFVENAANCFGLGMEESLRLTLAAEEVFMHLARFVMPSGGPVKIVCSDGGYYAQAVFSLPAGAFDMRAFNLTATISVEDDADLEMMGLVIASRSVDRFVLSREEGYEPKLTLIKEKTYPAVPSIPPAAVRPPEKTELRRPQPEEVKYITQLAASSYDARNLSDILLYPGKLVDMLTAGEYDSLAAVGSAGEIAGAIFWHPVGQNMVECFGPYVFNRDGASKLPEELLEGCISAVARTQALGIISTRPTPEFPKRHFEPLGTLDVYAADGTSMPVEAWFRLLHEDMGAAVWVHPGIDRFIRKEFARLVLPREVRINEQIGETLPRHSVLSAEFDRLQGRVTLRPIWPGADAGENIERHVKLMESEKIPNIHFAIDLGQAWQTIFVPGILDLGFEPRLVLPYAGKADTVIFQPGGRHAS